MKLTMAITQGDNGWVMKYTGLDGLEKEVVTTRWARVEKEINDYFGWYDLSGKHSKKPFYDEDNK